MDASGPVLISLKQGAASEAKGHESLQHEKRGVNPKVYDVIKVVPYLQVYWSINPTPHTVKNSLLKKR